MLAMHKISLYTVIITLCASISACSSSQITPGLDSVTAPGVAATSSFNSSPRQLMQQAQQSQGTDAAARQLQAASELIRQRQYDLATNLLHQIAVSQLSPADAAEQQLLFARIGLLQNQPGNAIQALNSIQTPDQLSNDLQVNQLKLRAAALLQLGQVLNSIETRVQLQALLSNDAAAQKENTLIIWKQIQRLSTQGLTDISHDTTKPVLAGWADLALIIDQYGNNNAQQLASQLQNWRQQYPQHPANALLPTSFDSDNVETPSISQIALLLPLKGPYKSQAEAVMNGLLAAYHQLPKTQQPKIRIYDTDVTNSNVTDLYNQAIKDGAQFVIGPLTKGNVQSIISNGACAVPTLLLNYTPINGQLPNQCYQFGISPTDEATQAATRAWVNNYDHAVIISPQGDWGKAIADSFQKRWQTLGGKVVAELDFSDQETLATQISELMGVAQSNQRAKVLSRVLLQTVKFLPRRRKDIGVIFLNATNSQARQIVPLLKFNFTGRIPIFATSIIYNGIPRPNTDRDLNDVRFLAMPWSISPSKEQKLLRDQLQQLWPENFRSNSKLYALGIDSLLLMRDLNRMVLFPQIPINGVTGKLTLETSQQITQQMPWAEFIHGEPRALTTKDQALYGD